MQDSTNGTNRIKIGITTNLKGRLSSIQTGCVKHPDFKPCAGCGKGVMHDQNIAFYHVKVDYMLCDLNAIQRAAGMEMMMGGHASIAYAMGEQRDLASVFSVTEFLLCLECSIRKAVPIAQFVETESEVAA